MSTFRIHHVSRHLAKHNFELDDRLYGSPVVKKEVDWVLRDPAKYLEQVEEELVVIRKRIGDLVCIYIAKGIHVLVPEEIVPTLEDADAHVFHKLHTRQFTYAEKLSQMLGNKSQSEIKLDVPKARRQLNVLLAAREDLLVTKVRFEAYSKKMEQEKKS